MAKGLEGLEEGPKYTYIRNTDIFSQKNINIKLENAWPWWHTWILIKKKLTSIHDRLALEMNRCQQEAHVPKWMTKGKTTLIQKDPFKGTVPNNYRLIVYQPIIQKISTAQTREVIYESLKSCELFPKEQKGCHKGSRGTGELLYIDQHMLNESTTRRKNLAMAWIENKKAHNSKLPLNI